MPEKIYLGDSVYCQFDGHGFVLTTENGMPHDPSNKIYLEPEVIHALFRNVNRIIELKGEENEQVSNGTD